MRAAVVALAVLAGGCETLAGDETMPADGSRYTCNPGPVQNLIGQAASQALGGEAVRTSGARTMRWITPGSAYTMDYRTDRLNIHLDAQNRVTRVDCG